MTPSWARYPRPLTRVLLLLCVPTTVGACDAAFGITAANSETIRFVQHANSSEMSLSTPQCSVALPAPSEPDALIVLTITHDVTRPVVSISDNLANTYDVAIPSTPWAKTAFATELYYAKGVNGAAPIVATITLARDGASLCDLYLDEYANASPTDPLDQTAANTGDGTGTKVSSGFKTTTHASELLFGHGEASGPTVTIGAGFFERSNAYANIEEDRNVTTVGSYDAQFSLTGAGEWIALMATFR